MISLFLSGNPRPAPRHRHRPGGGYNPAWYENQLTAWGWEAREQMMSYEWLPMTGRLGVEIHFRRSDERRADIDNLAKGVMDALNNIAYQDDSQIDRFSITVERGVGDDRPGVTVSIWNLRR